MLRVIGEQNKILLQSQMDQLREMKDMFNNMLNNFRNNQNPLQIIQQFKEAGLIPGQTKSQPGNESIEQINARFDAQAKLLGKKMEMERMRHDWNIQREDKIAQKENTKEWGEHDKGYHRELCQAGHWRLCKVIRPGAG
jgi:hypothetical protein